MWLSVAQWGDRAWATPHVGRWGAEVIPYSQDWFLGDDGSYEVDDVLTSRGAGLAWAYTDLRILAPGLESTYLRSEDANDDTVQVFRLRGTLGAIWTFADGRMEVGVQAGLGSATLWLPHGYRKTGASYSGSALGGYWFDENWGMRVRVESGIDQRPRSEGVNRMSIVTLILGVGYRY